MMLSQTDDALSRVRWWCLNPISMMLSISADYQISPNLISTHNSWNQQFSCFLFQLRVRCRYERECFVLKNLNLNIFGKSKSLLPTVRDIFPFLPVFPSYLGIMLVKEAHEGKAPRSSRITLLGGRSSHLNFWWNKEQPLICTKWKRASIIPWAGRCHRHPQTFQTEAVGPENTIIVILKLQLFF